MPTVNEYLRDDAIRHAVDFDRYARGVVQRMVAVLNRADARIAAELAVRLADIDAGQQTTTLLEAVLASVRQLNAQAYQVIGRELTAELQALAGVESEYVGELLRTAIPVQVSVTTVTAEQAYAAAMARPFQGVLLREALADLEDGHARRFRDAIRQGFVEGKTTQAIVREIRGTRARQYTDGIVQMDRRRLEAVVRTALSHTAAVAREQVYDANPDLIKGFRWTSTLDLRTTEPCRIRDGRLYDRDRKPVGHSIPWLAGPGRLHWNCRSTEIIVTPSYRELGLDIDEVPPGTRASMDGQVPADRSYADWIKAQSAARQDEILGPSRGKLLRAGGLSLDDLYSRRGEPLTLDELRDRHRAAFERAGV
ncbi:MAG TPA: phage minor head protein [Quisquiliibacterium sp.]|nr:phage minor head protein [Quisquiliibacterium sp.]